mgnify:CR=1 FL=1
MMKIISPHANTSLKPIRNALFVLYPCQVNAEKSTGWQKERDELLYYRCNPRNTDYMLALVDEFKTAWVKDGKCDLLIADSLYNKTSENDFAGFEQVFTDIEQVAQKKNEYDTIVYLFTDAIGIGWEKIEPALAALQISQEVVINGRRRIFMLDTESKRALSMRRFFSRAWFFEMLLTPALIISAIWFLLVDAISALFVADRGI